MSNSGQSFKAAGTFGGRQPEELHIPPAPANPPPISSRRQSTQDYVVHTDQFMAPKTNNLHALGTGPYNRNSLSSSNLPGALQSGISAAGRPHAISTNTAPSLIPTVPQMSMHPQSNSGNVVRPINTHGHSRSSPAGFEQPRYKQQQQQQGSSAAEDPRKYVSSSYNSSYHPMSKGGGGSALSPLGLADIRSSGGDLLVDSAAMSPRSRLPTNNEEVPRNSNYIAPWPIYAMDWCKWPVHHGGAGKIAFGSYLEDSHNYVCHLPVRGMHIPTDI